MTTDSTVREALARPDLGSLAMPKFGEALVPRPALLDVLVEQIEYLTGHASAPCPAGCSDCARLEQVKRWLLAPFQ
jgi:hypothetical protein